MSSNLNNLIEEKCLEFQNKVSVPFVISNGLEPLERMEELKSFIRQSITEAVEKTLEAVELKEREVKELPLEQGGHLAGYDWNQAILEIKKLKSNWLGK